MPKLKKALKKDVALLRNKLLDLISDIESVTSDLEDQTGEWRDSFDDRSDKWRESDAGQEYEEQLTSVEAITEHLGTIKESIEELETMVGEDE